MKLEDYIPQAMRTNKDRDTISANPQMVVNVLALFISAGNMLDQIKKHVFYGREYNTEHDQQYSYKYHFHFVRLDQ